MITALTVVTILGGTGTITLPDEVQALEVESKFEVYSAQHSIQGLTDELQQIRWRIEGQEQALANAQRRNASQDEIDRLKDDLEWLRKRERQIQQSLKE